jgi:hypothetical protein
LKQMAVRTSLYNPGHVVPERNWLYRMANRHWFNDFGVYRGHVHGGSSVPAVLARQTHEKTPVGGDGKSDAPYRENVCRNARQSRPPDSPQGACNGRREGHIDE